MSFLPFARQKTSSSSPCGISRAGSSFLAITLAWCTVQVANAATLLHVEAYGREFTLDADDGAVIHAATEVQLRGAGYTGFYEPPSTPGPRSLVNSVRFQVLDVPEELTFRTTRLTLGFGAGESIHSGFRPLDVGEYVVSRFGLCTATTAHNNCSPSLSVDGLQNTDNILSVAPAPNSTIPFPSLFQTSVDEASNDVFVRHELPWISFPLPIFELYSQLSGRFEILEAEYGPNGEVVRFAVDFEQYDHTGNADVVGQLRYNSTIPVPEPATLWMTLGSVVGIGVMRRRR